MSVIVQALLVLSVFVCFYPAIHGAFIVDDYPFIVDNPHLRSLANMPRFFTDTSTIAGIKDWGTIYRPLRTVVFALEYAAWAEDPRGYHLVSLMLHAINSLLLFHLLRRLTGSPSLSSIVSALFAIHPVQTESVVWIASQGDLLSTSFLLGSLILFLLSEAENKRHRAIGTLFLLLSLGAFSLALLSKEIAVCLPLLLAFREVIMTEETRRGFRRFCVLLPYFIMLLFYLGLKFLVVKNTPHYDYLGDSFMATVFSMSSVVLRYLRLLVIPYPLCFFYYWLPKYRDILHVQVLSGMLAVLSILVVWLFCLMNKRKAIALFIFWFMLFFVPVSNLIVPLNVLMAERFLYLPLIGFFTAWGLFVSSLQLKPRHRKLITLTVMIGIAAGGVLTFQRSVQWMTPESLWSFTVDHFPRSYMGRDGLARLALERGDYDRAEQYLSPLSQWYPRGFTHLYTLGQISLARGRFNDAESFFNRALVLSPDNEKILTMLGTTAASQGDGKRALAFFRRAISEYPLYPNAWSGLGTLLDDLGDSAEAGRCFKRAYELSPRSSETLANLAGYYLEQGDHAQAEELLTKSGKKMGEPARIVFLRGRLEELRQNYRLAILLYREAMVKGLDDPMVLYRLGTTWLLQGNYVASCRSFSTLYSRHPDFPKNVGNWAVAMHLLGRSPEAVILLRHQLIKTPGDEEMRKNLALILHESGQSETP
jgi:protein O-mannosyl-transferase